MKKQQKYLALTSSALLFQVNYQEEVQSQAQCRIGLNNKAHYVLQALSTFLFCNLVAHLLKTKSIRLAGMFLLRMTLEERGHVRLYEKPSKNSLKEKLSGTKGVGCA